MCDEATARVEKGLRRLRIPDWFSKSPLAKGSKGFILSSRRPARLPPWPQQGQDAGSAGATPVTSRRHLAVRRLNTDPGLVAVNDEVFWNSPENAGALRQVESPDSYYDTASLACTPVSPRRRFVWQDYNAGDAISLDRYRVHHRWENDSGISVTSPDPLRRRPFGSSRSYESLSHKRTQSTVSADPGTPLSMARRQPYMGWRSMERLSKPRTPEERLAASLLRDRENNGHVPTTGTEFRSLPNSRNVPDTKRGAIKKEPPQKQALSETQSLPSSTAVRTSPDGGLKQNDKKPKHATNTTLLSVETSVSPATNSRSDTSNKPIHPEPISLVPNVIRTTVVTPIPSDKSPKRISDENKESANVQFISSETRGYATPATNISPTVKSQPVSLISSVKTMVVSPFTFDRPAEKLGQERKQNADSNLISSEILGPASADSITPTVSSSNSSSERPLQSAVTAKIPLRSHPVSLVPRISRTTFVTPVISDKTPEPGGNEIKENAKAEFISNEIRGSSFVTDSIIPSSNKPVQSAPVSLIPVVSRTTIVKTVESDKPQVQNILERSGKPSMKVLPSKIPKSNVSNSGAEATSRLLGAETGSKIPTVPRPKTAVNSESQKSQPQDGHQLNEGGKITLRSRTISQDSKSSPVVVKSSVHITKPLCNGSIPGAEFSASETTIITTSDAPSRHSTRSSDNPTASVRKVSFAINSEAPVYKAYATIDLKSQPKTESSSSVKTREDSKPRAKTSKSTRLPQIVSAVPKPGAFPTNEATILPSKVITLQTAVPMHVQTSTKRTASYRAANTPDRSASGRLENDPNVPAKSGNHTEPIRPERKVNKNKEQKYSSDTVSNLPDYSLPSSKPKQKIHTIMRHPKAYAYRECTITDL